jgi:2-hydroxychromene-2-carboxylate isomerase
MADVDVFFDFTSAYTYLARTQLDGIAAPHRRAIQDLADASPQSDEDRGQYSQGTVVCGNKRKYAGQHIGRWCARYQVPFKANPHLRGDHRLTLRGALVAQEMNLEEQYNQAVFSAFWTDAVNVTDRGEVVRYLEAAGLDGNSILAKAEGDEYAQHRASNTRFTADRGSLVRRPLSCVVRCSLETIVLISSRRP